MRPRTVAIAAVLAVAAAPAQAGCEVDSTGLAFGAITLDQTNETAGRITVRCDEPATFEVGLTTPGGQRVMNGPNGATLDYRIFVDPSYTVEWGDGTTIGPRRGGSADATTPAELTMYGVIPAQAGLPAGTYTTTVLVTVLF